MISKKKIKEVVNNAANEEFHENILRSYRKYTSRGYSKEEATEAIVSNLNNELLIKTAERLSRGERVNARAMDVALDEAVKIIRDWLK